MATWKIFVKLFNSLYSKEHVKVIETRPREMGFVLWCQILLDDPRTERAQDPNFGAYLSWNIFKEAA